MAFLMRGTYDLMRLRQHKSTWHLSGIFRGRMARISLSGLLHRVAAYSVPMQRSLSIYMVIRE